METLIQTYSELKTMDFQKTLVLQKLKDIALKIEDEYFLPQESIQEKIETNPYYKDFFKHISSVESEEWVSEGQYDFLRSTFDVTLFNNQVFVVEFYQARSGDYYNGYNYFEPEMKKIYTLEERENQSVFCFKDVKLGEVEILRNGKIKYEDVVYDSILDLNKPSKLELKTNKTLKPKI